MSSIDDGPLWWLYHQDLERRKEGVIGDSLA
jgi:hypothetical protein